MAPRRSVQKRGLRRIDAALDALRPMGFEDKVVRRTVANLLKAYGGDAGWIFIEEGYYKLVIDTIVDEQENVEPKLMKEDCSYKHLGSIIAVTSMDANDTEHASSSNKSTVEIGKTTGIAFPAACCDDEDEPLIGELQVTETPDSAAQTPKQPGGSDMKQRRGHYYHGWISNDWQEDLVELKPGPLAEKVAKLLLENFHKKRKRWDVKPEDM